MLLTILLGGVWPALCAATSAACAYVVWRDSRRRDDSVQRADQYASEAWGYVSEVRELRDQIRDTLVQEAMRDSPTDVIVRSIQLTPAQAERARGAAGRHRKDTP